ncbi:hypothetical protein LC612_39355 [Nostoc sp. CHAB 5834]|nr:hypothetical protein [Nostoc sp. CHAB 5834]
MNKPFDINAELVFVECEVLGLKPSCVADHHQPGDPGYGKPPSAFLEASSLGQVLRILGLDATQEQRIIAAADHCPTQAYRGECPGVTPEELADWRTRSRALRRGVTPEEMEKAIEEARLILEAAERIDFCGERLPWISLRGGEIAEASARYNIPFMYMEPSRTGGTKMGIMGANPDIISAWMRDCRLDNVYGDPARGYAGGYCN